MENYYSILYMVGAFLVAILLAVAFIKFRNSAADIESRLTGIWVNESKTIKILLHHIDSVFQGKVIWVNSENQQILGCEVIKDLVLNTLAQGSSGIYIDPITGIELPFQIWFKGKRQLKLAFISKVNGKNKVVKEEEWFQV